MGAKKFGMPLKPRENKSGTFQKLRGVPVEYENLEYVPCLELSERRKGVVLIRGCFHKFNLVIFVVSVVFVIPRHTGTYSI